MSAVAKSRVFAILLGLSLSVGLFSQIAQAYSADFELVDIHGKVHRLSDYRGKWVVVNYWATWCPPCLEEIPDLEIFHNKYKDSKAIVLGVNVENISAEKLKKFVEDRVISYPILRGKPESKTSLGRISGMPTTYLVTPEGEVVARQSGKITVAAIESFIKKYQPEE
jgi:thiol-disulfide isomerase/thioredoxin